ncbi:LCP family protein [Clostridium sp.]|uniref:LCP family protein n=1 Tax=Clostridium sp. TaxID=1506 RepID=UPI003F3742B8
MKKKTKLWLIAILIILAIPLTVVLGLGAYAYNLSSKINRVETTKEEIGVTPKTEEELSQYPTYEKIINIALFGIDAPDASVGRSDTIMILSIDPNKKEIKLSSLMRDSYVNIPDYGMDKLNHAFAFGNSVLALNTINQNFEVGVDKFMSVNFTSLPIIIDKLGGIEVTLQEDELSHINNHINSVNSKTGASKPLLTAPGSYILDGGESLAYTRIRYAEGGDYKRTERQRTIMKGIFEKAIKINPTQYPSLLNDFLPLIETNISTSELLSLGTTIFDMKSPTLKEDRFPRDGFCQGETIDGIYYLTFDNEETKNQIREFIYGE